MTEVVGFVANRTEAPVLPALRAVLDGADEALVCSAFVDRQGVQLVAKELRAVARRGSVRLVATTTFSGSRALGALDDAADLGVACRVRNPSRGTFHPKVAVARHGRDHVALVGSANLTRGLVVNDEAGTVLRGPLTEVREATEAWWSDAVDLAEVHGEREADVIDADLWQRLSAVLSTGDVVETLARPSPNQIVALARSGLLVETPKSRREGAGPQPIDPAMLNTAWDALRADGEVTGQRLQGELRVHRSSFVVAALSMLADVEVVSRRPITLRWTGDDVTLAADESGPYSP